MLGLNWSLESERHAEKFSLTFDSSMRENFRLLLPAGQSRFVDDAIESGWPLLIVRRGAGPLHIAREYGKRVITRCGTDYPTADVTVFRSKTEVTGVWANWPKKCAGCRAGIL